MRATSAVVRMVIPTLGERLEWLATALQSVQSQDVLTELLVVGPSSATHAKRLARRFSATWRDQSKAGLGRAINEGFRDARTPFVAWLGDDDLLARGSLRRTVSALESDPEAVMAYGRILCIDENGLPLFRIAPGRFAATWMHIGHDFVPQPGSLFRRDAVARVGGLDESLQYAMDLDLFIRLHREGRFRYLSSEVASFRRHQASLTVANRRPGEEARLVRRRYLGPAGLIAEGLAFPLLDAIGRGWAKGFLLDSRVRGRAVSGRQTYDP